jgi:hypothetical protein
MEVRRFRQEDDRKVGIGRGGAAQRGKPRTPVQRRLTGHDWQLTIYVCPVNRITDEEVVMGKRRSQHVVPSEQGWAVRAAGSERATKVYRTQRRAIAAAKRIAKRQETELVIHSRNGRIRDKSTYAKDPFPPKG